MRHKSLKLHTQSLDNSFRPRGPEAPPREPLQAAQEGNGHGQDDVAAEAPPAGCAQRLEEEAASRTAGEARGHIHEPADPREVNAAVGIARERIEGAP